MQKQEKSRKPLIVGIIAAVVILAVLLVLLLTQCTGGQGEASTPTTEDISSQEYQLYWNLDKAEYSGKSEAGLSSRKPAEDGFFYVRFFYEGEVVTLKVADRRTINAIDVQDLMGLEFDENGVVVGVQKLDDLPLEKVGWQFFVQSAARTVIKLNSSESLNGMEIMLEEVDPNRVWDMSGRSGEPGTVCTPVAYDKVMAVQNLEGKTTHVFIYDRPNYMATHMAYCQHCDKEVEWSEWEKENDVPKKTGHYQLQNDIAYTGGQVALADETMICLDLNGYRIDGKANTRLYRLKGAAISFALMDTSEAQTGVVVGHGKSDQGGLFWVSNGAFYMYGGTLDGSGMTTQKYAPVVAISKGAYFYMYDGKIIGGTAKPTYVKETGKYSGGYAGSVYVQGKFVMNGGIIENGRAKSTITYKDGKPAYNRGYGGNILVTTGGVFEMNDGIIRGGKSDGQGGNIYTSSVCEITMNGGSIQGGICYGKGKNGGNISVNNADAIFTMNGGSIVGGVSYNAAGNVYNAGQFIMNSGYIGSGALMKYGENERNTSGTSYNMLVANGQLTLWGGSVAGGLAVQDTKADGKYQTKLNIYGWAKVHGDENGKNLTIVKGGDDVVVNVGTLYKGADIYVNASGIFTKPTKEANLNYFHSDVENVDVIYYQKCLALGKAVCICGASQTSNPDAHDVGCNGEVLFWGPWTDDASLPRTTGNYYLTKDVTTTGQTTVGIGQDVKVDLNGHNATLQVRTSAYDGFRLYRADDGAKLAITDTQAKLTGKVGTLKTVMPDKDAVYSGDSFVYGDVTYEGQAAKDKAREIWDKRGNYGMLLWARGGHISVHNGIFDGSNLSTSQTGMIWHIGSHSVTDAAGVKTPYYGQINFYNGRVICGNLTDGYGAINVNSGCALNIYGGTVENGVDDAKVKTRIYVSSNGKLLLAGGNIDGGINVAGTVTLSGAPVVGKEDGALYSAKEINIDGTLKTGAQVHTSKTGFLTGETVEENKKYVHSDLEGVEVTYYQKRLAIGRTSCICGASKTSNPDAHDVGCDGEVLFWGAWTDKDRLPTTNGNYYLVNDVTTTGQSTVGIGRDVKVDLNGKNVTRKVLTSTYDGFRLYRVEDGAKLAITDTQAKLTGKVGTLKTVMPDKDAVYSGDSFVYGDVTYEGQAAKDKAREIWDKIGNFGMLLWARGGHISVHNGIFDGSNLSTSQTGMIWHIASHSVTDAAGVNTPYYGQINLYNGRVICGNLTDGYGAINVNSGCALNIYGGTVENGVDDAKVKTRIYVASNGKLLLAGGNTDGGINVAGSVTLSGAPVVGNEDGGLYSAAAINIDGTLATGAQVYTSKSGFITGETVEANKNYILSTEGLDVTYMENKLFAAKMGCLCNYGKTVNGEKVTAHTAGCIAAMADIGLDPTKDKLQMSNLTAENYANIKEGGHFYLASDVTVGTASSAVDAVHLGDNTTVIIDLNGKTLTIYRAGMAFSTQNATTGNACLIITDTSAEGNGKIEVIGSGTNQGGIIRVWGKGGSNNRAFLLGGTLDASQYMLGNESKQVYGGAVEVHYGHKMYMYGGTVIGSQSDYISDGSAVNVSSSGHMYMHGGTIYGGKNANVSVVKNSNVFEMYGGTICGGVTSSTDKVKISGTAVINKNLTPAGITVPSYSLSVATGKTVDFGGLTTGAEVYVTAGGKFGINADATIATLVKADSPNGKVVLDGTDLVMGYADRTNCECGGKLNGKYGHVCNEVVWKAWDKTTSPLPNEAGNWYLIDDVNLTANVTVPEGVTIRLDLAGKKVSLATDIQMYKFNGNGQSTLVITDTVGGEGVVANGSCASNGGIMDIKDQNTVKIYNVILDASARTLAENGGIAAVRAGSHLTTYNVTIKGGLVAKAAGAFRMFNDGGLHVYGGTISGSKVTDKGGVLYANGTGVMHFEDVTIEDSEAVGNGGAFCVTSTTQLTLKNCTITGAKTAGYGGALYQSGTAQVTISGTTTITANTTADGLNKSNIFVNGGKLIIADDFTGTISLAGKTGAALVDNVTALDNKFITGGNIILDDPSNYRFKIYDGKLGMEEIPPKPRMQCVCGGVLNGTEGHTHAEVEFKPWTSTDSLPTDGNWYLTKNVVLSAAAAIGVDVNIDLNGKTVSNPNGAVLNVTAGTVTITDSTATAGTLSGGAGGVIKTSGTAVLNLYAGTVTGGKSDDGAVQLTGTSKMKLAGKVQIVDNTTADGSAACNVVANGGTMAFLPGFSGNVRIAGAYGKLVVTGITSESDPLLTGGNVALDDNSGNFKLVASADGLTYGLVNQSLKYACVCGGTLNGKYGHTCEKIFWEPWDSATSLPTTTGNYYLKNTVNLASAGAVAEGATVRLDLNGKTVNLADTVRVYTFEDNYNSTLIVTDTTSTPGSVIAVGTAGNGGILDVQEQNTAEIYNVTLDASARTITEHGSVAVVRPGSHLTTYNVTMKGGTTGTKKDGGVFRLVGDSTGTTDGGSVTVYGGTINGGTATYRGGVLYAKDNCAASFTDVSINGGTALRAGGFYISNTTRLTLKNTTINGCTSTGGYSGAIYADGANVVELDGVTIQNCTSTTAGGAILLNNKDAQLVIKGNTVITGNKMGDTKSNIAASYAKTVTIDPSFNGTVSFVAKKTGVALISGVTDLADPRLGVNILLDDPVSYAFALYEDGGVDYIGLKAN